MNDENREIKKVKKKFTIAQYDKEEVFLREMHKQGWRFVKISGICTYVFEKCQPEDVVYVLDYNRGHIDEEEYKQKYISQGWSYIYEFMGYRYFIKKAADIDRLDENLFSPANRLALVNRVVSGRFAPLWLFLMCIIIPQYSVHMSRDGAWSPGNRVVAIGWTVAFLLYTAVFAILGYQFMSLRKRINEDAKDAGDK